MRRAFLLVIAAAIIAVQCTSARGQSFGVELNNTLMPAAGGMGGVSIAEPQDVTSAINGNPATMMQFRARSSSLAAPGPSRRST